MLNLNKKWFSYFSSPEKKHKLCQSKELILLLLAKLISHKPQYWSNMFALVQLLWLWYTKRKHVTKPLTSPCVFLQLVELSSVRIRSTVTSRFAHTTMTSRAENKALSPQEISFDVELPKTAFITNFSMSVKPLHFWEHWSFLSLTLTNVWSPGRETDGQLFHGEVKEKEAAKEQYNRAVFSGQTAGLVKYVELTNTAVWFENVRLIKVMHVDRNRASGRTMETFSVSVNVAARSSVTFILTYEELLQRKLGQYELLTRVKPKEPVQDFQVLNFSFSFMPLIYFYKRLVNMSDDEIRYEWEDKK